MPAFTFEKLSPPRAPRSSIAPVAAPEVVSKPRSVIVQFLDRFVDVRVKRTLRQDKGGVADPRSKPRG